MINEILKNAGLNEEIVNKKPIKKRKTSKKVNEKVKLSSILNDLLLEAVDLSDGSKVIRALERGQVPGVKKKVFLKTSFSKNQVEETLNNVIGIVSSKVGENDKNKYLFLIFKRAGNIEWLDQFNDEELNEIVDSMMAYFGNKNKKEAKENEEVKKKFDEYENSKLNFEDDKKFEQWANEKFAHKAKAKDDDIDVVYDDGEWNVSIPKTFAAAKKLACMADRKARWCTAASEGMYKTYSSKDNPLFIIRNEKKDLMYQMDWGKYGNPNFMDEQDRSAKIADVLGLGIPADLWKKIKNKDGESVYDKLKPALQKDGESIPLNDINKTPAKDLGDWRETVFITVNDFMNDVGDKIVPAIFGGEKDNMRDILAGEYSTGGPTGAKRIAKYEKDGEVYYHITPREGIRLAVSTEDKFKIVLKQEGENLVYLKTNELVKTDLPDFFTDSPLIDKKGTSGDLEGWEEYIYPSAGEFLREIKDYEMPKLIGDAQSMTRMLDNNTISQIGRISKGKKIYYYLIPKPGHEITLGSRGFIRGEGARSKSFGRVAFQKTGNKLTIKTARTVAQSDLPQDLKQKLFTSYSIPHGENEIKFVSILKDQLKKDITPKPATGDGTNKIYTDVDSFGKIINIPDLGENAIEAIKLEITRNRFDPKNLAAVYTGKFRSSKIAAFITKQAETHIIEGGSISTNKTFFTDRIEMDKILWLYDNIFINSNVFTKEEKEVFNNMRNNGYVYKFKNGEILRRDWGVNFVIEKDGKEYYGSLHGGERNWFVLRTEETEALSKEVLKDLQSQGLDEKIKISYKFIVR